MPRAKPTGIYRSKFEARVADILPKATEYEPFAFEYFTPHMYTPDFVFGDTYIECKGFFRAGDMQKYVAIKNSLEDGEELVFVLSHPNKPVRRKAKLTMGGWCDKHELRWFGENNLVALIREIKEFYSA